MAGAVLAVSALATASSVGAQSSDELVDAFSGEWYVFDPAFSKEGGACRIRLKADSIDAAAEAFVAASNNCSEMLGTTTGWQVDGENIILLSDEGARIAALGGNPQRLSGDYAAPPNAVVLERESGSGLKRELSAAIRAHGCYFLGYTSNCVEASATEAPVFSEGVAEIDVLVNLNVRNQPRRGASVIGTVPPDSTLTVNTCLTTSDGIWCRARFGDTEGWMSKSALRQGEWPVITYVTASDPENS